MRLTYTAYLLFVGILLKALHAVCIGKEIDNENVSSYVVKKALNLLAPKDKRTLIELCLQGLRTSPPCVLLLERSLILLQRELRRTALNARIIEMSKGKVVTDEYVKQVHYWIAHPEVVRRGSGIRARVCFHGMNGAGEVYKYDADLGNGHHRFIHRETRMELLVKPTDKFVVSEYIEVPEAITRAQKAFMTIELDHGKKFTYVAFTEFQFMRASLRQLQVLSQLQCEELDNARLNVLQSIKEASQLEIRVDELEPGMTYYKYENKQYDAFVVGPDFRSGDAQYEAVKLCKIAKVPPQHVIVVGGGPTGLCTAIHCLENVLASDGTMRLYESRDAFLQAGATFERSQIVRLDARWIGILRYHLGTIFEDVFVPASGETASHYGNILPSQGFIEITIKDLENMMNIQVVKFASRELLKQDTNSGASYDVNKNQLIKLGKALKKDDLVRFKVDPNGFDSEQEYTWTVKELNFAKPLDLSAIELMKEYAIYTPKNRMVAKYRLIGMNMKSQEYAFEAIGHELGDFMASARENFYIYPKGTKVNGACESIILECLIRNDKKSYCRIELPYKDIESEPFVIDVGHCHVAEAIGKPIDSPVHFSITTSEPYGVCCLSGLKVAMGMHNFGVRRWRIGIIDDIRSHTDQNTRVVGDFTKIVNAGMIVKKMNDLLVKETNWRLHFEKLACDGGFSTEADLISMLLRVYLEKLISQLPFKRSHLQTRFFETGDNFYLGMEFPREYARWKIATVDALVASLAGAAAGEKDKMKAMSAMKGTLAHSIDRLWYQSALDVIKLGDVYNPGGHIKVPHLDMIDSLIDCKLSSLDVGETFRVTESPALRYEILFKETGIFGVGSNVIVRDFEGRVSKMSPSTVVRRGGNLTRSPDGLTESRVSIATFPVSHYLNHRTMRLNNRENGYVFAFLGDEQSTPHFMRYSGLTGACINAMSLNNFIGDLIHGDGFNKVFREFSSETNWSNGEVVLRGTGSNYGQDGFLRPGFPYKKGIKYLRSKIIEYRETAQSPDDVLSRDWKNKFIAALIPRGMEFNSSFINSLLDKLKEYSFAEFLDGIAADEAIEDSNSIIELLKERLSSLMMSDLMSDRMPDRKPEEYWNVFMDGLSVNREVKLLIDPHVWVAMRLDVLFNQLVEFAQEAYDSNDRVGQQLEHQPKSLDVVIDDFAVEAQTFANSLAQSATFSAVAISLQLQSTAVGAGGLFSFIGLFISFGTVTNVARYQNRNEEWRVQFADHKFMDLLKAVYSVMRRKDREMLKMDNPYLKSLEKKKDEIVRNMIYYDIKPETFMKAYDALVTNIHSVDAINAFMKELTSNLISIVYYENSYVQEDLVSIYAIAEELLRVESAPLDNSQDGAAIAAVGLFQRLLLFVPRLETSLQRGQVLYGYSKQKQLKHYNVIQLIWYFMSIAWCARTRRTGLFALPTTVQESTDAAGSVIKPVSVETQELAAQMKSLWNLHQSPGLLRGAMELESLYYATLESSVMSFILCLSYLSIMSGVVFTIGNIGRAASPTSQWAQDWVMASSWSLGTISPIGAALGAAFLATKLRLVLSCDIAVGKHLATIREGDENFWERRHQLKTVRQVAHLQFFFQFLRMLACLAAAVALPWALAASYNLILFGDRFTPLWLATASACVQVLTVFLLLVMDYSILYNLDTRLGVFVCDAFDVELKQMKENLTLPVNTIQTKQVQERISWEYVARAFLHRYRFDTFFTANRCGSIFQYIQSGLQRR